MFPAADQYIVATLFASVFGFLLLYVLHRKKSLKSVKDDEIRTNIVQSSINTGDSSPETNSGIDVIIVGAGVAGAALAHTLGKVLFLSFFFLFFIFFF